MRKFTDKKQISYKENLTIEKVVMSKLRVVEGKIEGIDKLSKWIELYSETKDIAKTEDILENQVIKNLYLCEKTNPDYTKEKIKKIKDKETIKSILESYYILTDDTYVSILNKF